MAGTTMEGAIPSLFQGQYVVKRNDFIGFICFFCVFEKQYVRCTKVDHESRVKQTFYDVPLQVRNNANSKRRFMMKIVKILLCDWFLVTESFRDFCKSEILSGENLYDAGSVHGLQVRRCFSLIEIIELDFSFEIGSRERS